MAVSKRTRFEVLRRDNYACRYCGATAPDVKLTVDHVTPLALGGADDPSNLAACCSDCNFGKSSTSPDEQTVAQVDERAIQWAAAMREAVAVQRRNLNGLERLVDHFAELWNQWKFTDSEEPISLPSSWRSAVRVFVEDGLNADDMEYCIAVAMDAHWVSDTFPYCMGVCRNHLANRASIARELMEG